MSFIIFSREFEPRLSYACFIDPGLIVRYSRIPQYHAEEATKAIMPLLGDSYHADKQRSFWGCIWESFTQCQYVVPDDLAAKPEHRAMYYKGGPSPPVEISMGRAGLRGNLH